MVHVRRHEGRVLDFGVSGSLWNDALVMYDRQTESYWTHVTGECLEGPLEGARLRQLPATVTTFKEWVEAHPHTRVLKKGWNEGTFSHYERYVASERQGIFATRARRKELDPKALVQGVAASPDAVAIPFGDLPPGETADFELGGKDMTAVRAGSSIIVYERRAGEHALQLETLGRGSGLQLRDRRTRTRWDARTGKGVDGPLAEHELSAVPSTTAYWFGWLNFFPRARIVKPSG